MSKMFRIAVACGGPSLERGISLNSARSVCDHLSSEALEVVPIYFDYRTRPYRISRAQLYSNTPSDFDFKLATSAQALSSNGLRSLLRSVDLVFPAMHGPFGEDGGFQSLLEGWNIPFVGSSSQACKAAFDKYQSARFLERQGFNSVPSALLTPQTKNLRVVIAEFMRQQKVKHFIVKPVTGGSSIAVYSVSSLDEALKAAKVIFRDRVDRRAVIEPYLQGKEFTVIILQNRFNMPVAILPTEIEMERRDYQIFDYRRKYLATRQVTYHCPPRFSDETVDRIQVQAEQLFSLFGMQDFARFDGWLMPDGRITFTDFNPISGMEQNSFLFMQAARVGMSHRQMLRYVLASACRRHGLKLPEEAEDRPRSRKQVNVIFGGGTAERQVSLMSGTNVWLKLRRSKQYEPIPHLLDPSGYVWRIPYAFALNHSVEEVLAMCQHAKRDEQRLGRLKTRVLERLRLTTPPDEPVFVPQRMTLEQFIKGSKRVFLGLHGGMGEDGTIQRMLERRRVPFNGPGSRASRLCMDKFKTGQALKGLEKFGVLAAPKRIEQISRLQDSKAAWERLTELLGAKQLIVKPIDDGCSAGIVKLNSAKDLKVYLDYARRGALSIPPGKISNQHGIIEMPSHRMRRLMFEPFIVTDKVEVVKNRIKWTKRSGWIEVTVGVIDARAMRGASPRLLEGAATAAPHLSRKGMYAMNPSITVASGAVLSLEEKFQGGTGVNITPPPSSLVSPEILSLARKRIELVANKLGIKGYSRIDAFLHTKTGQVMIIEANTLPGLTPSTVIYHQALAETPPMYPLEFLERIIGTARS